MKTKLHFLFIGLALLAGVHQATAQSARFLRIVGPAATSITAFNPDGTIVWSNALSGANYTVQTVVGLPSSTNWVDYVQLPVTYSVNTNQILAFNPPTGMAFIPAGSFTMGDTLDGESDAIPANIYVSAFYMDTNLVSYSQWQAVYNWAISLGYGFFQSPYIHTYSAQGTAANHPVQRVDWFDCVKWLNARSQQAGLTPMYYTDAGFTQVFTNGDYGTTVYQNLSVNGYRLPTEAEWEKAARGGLSGLRFPWGNTISESQANYCADPANVGGFIYDLGPYYGPNTNFDAGDGPYTSPVGSFPANGYDLNDMAGNVFEWCWDFYGTPYGQPTTTNPTGPASGSFRVLRGGHWDSFADQLRCAYRYEGFTSFANAYLGFRCVRGL